MILSSVSVLGLTIDYGRCPCFWHTREPLTGTLGPYAFMDIFDRMHVCNHTDEGGRYAYRVGISKASLPPSVLTPLVTSVPAGDDVGAVASAAFQRSHSHETSSLFALRALLNALSPLVGAEAELGDRAVSAGWAKEATKDKVKEWSSKGVALVKEELEDTFQREYEAEYNARLRQARPLLWFIHSCASDAAIIIISALAFDAPRNRTTRFWYSPCWQFWRSRSSISTLSSAT